MKRLIFAYHFLRHGEWSCGFASRKTWKDKPYLALCGTYYDGYHGALHFGPFYVSIYY